MTEGAATEATEGTATEITEGTGTVITQSNRATEIRQRGKTRLRCSFSVALFLCVGPFAPSSPFPLSPSALVTVTSARQPHYPQLPSETPSRLVRPTDEYDHVRRDVMIPMRDGVRL